MLNLEVKLISIKTGCGKSEYWEHSHPRVLVSGKAPFRSPRGCRSKGGGKESVSGTSGTRTRQQPSQLLLTPGPRPQRGLTACVLAPLTTLSIQQSYLNVTHLLLCYWCIPQNLDGDGLKGAVTVIQVTGVPGKITTQTERIVQIPEIIGGNHV